MNNKAHLRPEDYDSNGDIIPMACKEEKGDLISREALKEVINDLFRSGEYDCNSVLKAINNAPSVEVSGLPRIHYDRGFIAGYEKATTERQRGKWIVTAEDNHGVHRICCPFCSYEKGSNNTDTIIVTFNKFPKFCENCGAELKGGAEE